MPLFAFFRFNLFFRLIGAIASVWLLYSQSGLAGQNPSYYPYPAYPARAPAFYPYPPTRYYPFYAPRYRQQTAPGVQRAKPVVPHTQLQPTQPARAVPATPKRTDTKKHSDKQKFIARLLPYIVAENRQLQQQRKKLQQLFNRLQHQQSLSSQQQNWLKNLARRYRIQKNPLTSVQARNELLRKVDIIPPSLALAQAANESAWGTSRFATEANNLFGIWTYDPDKGIVPQQRAAEKKHLIRKFDDIGASIRFYMYTLNTHPAYQKLRELRYQARLQNKPVDGYLLASGLESYSAKGKQYIKLIRALIRQNQWTRLDNPQTPGLSG